MSEYDDMNNEGNSPENQDSSQPQGENGEYSASAPKSGAPQQEPTVPPVQPPYAGGYRYAPPQQVGQPQQGYYPPQRPAHQQGRVSYVYNAPNTSPAPHTSAPRVSRGRKKGKRIFFTIMALLIITAVLLTGIAIGKAKNGTLGGITGRTKVDAPELTISDSDKGSDIAAGAPALKSGDLDPREVYQKIKDASVGILINYNGYNATSGEGSGVIVGEDSQGKYTYVITCAHVVSDGGEIKVQLSDESQYTATLIGSDARTDIAVLRIAKTGLTAIEIGDSEKLEVGETVYAIGNPGGVDFAGSFTNGMISAIARPISSEIGYQMVCIQHTAAINPGNSGGALVNASGQLIGINSSKIASTDYEGMGFAVPSSTFVKVYNEIIEHGYVTNRPKLGIRYIPAMSSRDYAVLVSANNLPVGSIVIASIDTDSALAATDVKQGDVIIKCNGVELEDADYLPDFIEKSKVGDTLTLTICRFDNSYKMTQFDVSVTLNEDKGTVSPQVEEPTTQQNQSDYSFDPFDFFGNSNGN